MRPSTIVWFESLYLLSLTIALLQVIMGAHRTYGADPAATILFFAMILGAIALLVLAASRRRSRIAKWMLALLYALLSWRIAEDLLYGWGVSLTDLAVPVMAGVATGLLFTTSARDWFSATPRSDALRRTFE